MGAHACVCTKLYTCSRPPPPIPPGVAFLTAIATLPSRPSPFFVLCSVVHFALFAVGRDMHTTNAYNLRTRISTRCTHHGYCRVGCSPGPASCQPRRACRPPNTFSYLRRGLALPTPHALVRRARRATPNASADRPGATRPLRARPYLRIHRRDLRAVLEQELHRRDALCVSCEHQRRPSEAVDGVHVSAMSDQIGQQRLPVRPACAPSRSGRPISLDAPRAALAFAMAPIRRCPSTRQT